MVPEVALRISLSGGDPEAMMQTHKPAAASDVKPKKRAFLI